MGLVLTLLLPIAAEGLVIMPLPKVANEALLLLLL
jgi:hypothetical protein